MSAKEQAAKTQRDWRERYNERSQELEKLEERYDEHTDLLQRLVTRISLNEDPEDKEFHRAVTSLRRKLKGNKTPLDELNEGLGELDKILLAQDEEHPNASDSKRPKNKDEKEGFWSRIFSGKQDEEAESQEDKSTLASLPTAGAHEVSENIDTPSSPAHPKLEIDNPEQAPGYGIIADRIGITLNNLLNQLSFPEIASRKAERLRTRIAKRINWYELPPTLEDLSALIISVVGKGQREFDTFLSSLNEQLKQINTFFEHQEDHDESWLALNQNFGDLIKQQSESLENVSKDTDDIDNIKRSIVTYVEEISIATADALTKGQRLSEANKPQLQKLQKRLDSLEKESDGLRNMLKEERSRALTDVLTGLPNRESFDERIQMELDRFERYGEKGLLVIGDIDHFKEINDTYGHLSGDKALQIIAKELKRRLRKADFIGRYGGEEFAIILPHTDIETGIQVIDKARERLASMPFHFRESDVSITMSFGIACFEKGMKGSKLFDRADKALYNAKAEGRNNVQQWQND
jgi:diguanylate cyclase